MMTKQQVEYELRHFRSAPRFENDRRQHWVLKKWDFRGVPGGVVLEIGPGPYGGCLPFIVAAKKIAVDPLLDDYDAEGLLGSWQQNWTPVAAYIEDLDVESWRWPLADALLCFNVLEHGTSSFAAIGKIAPLLAPGGRFYLEQSLRDASQLNEAHTHVMRVEDLDTEIGRAGLKVIRQWIEPAQPGFDYPMVFGIYENPDARLLAA